MRRRPDLITIQYGGIIALAIVLALTAAIFVSVAPLLHR